MKRIQVNLNREELLSLIDGLSVLNNVKNGLSDKEEKLVNKLYEELLTFEDLENNAEEV